ncbi:MAG TPA: NUDIX hydrolase [Coriobacteriia bacterium]|nr:NUDIX hydrolase [Coriobacteriia bacterium]
MAAPDCEGPRVRVAALVLMNGSVVLVRHQKGGRVYHLLPGGGVERGETLSQALVREVREETGLHVSVGRPLILSDTIDPSGTRHLVNVTFSADVTGGSIRPPAVDARVAGIDLIVPADLTALDLRPPIARELQRAIALGPSFQTAYLGPRFVGEA